MGEDAAILAVNNEAMTITNPIVNNDVATAPVAAPQTMEEFQISSMEDLKEKHKELYNEVIKGVSMQIINDMKKAEERLKKVRREANNS